MPLYKTIVVNSQTTVKIWKISESIKNLMAPLNLTKDSLSRIKAMKSEIHRKGYISVRHLLAEFGFQDSDLYYDAHGKPYLKSGKYISITHSFSFSAIIISDVKVGIDIEKRRDKIALIAEKFIGYEFQYLSKIEDDYINKLTVIWGIKESLYKLFATPGMFFKTHFMVIPFSLVDQETVAWIDFKNEKYRFHTHFFEFDEYTCVYALA